MHVSGMLEEAGEPAENLQRTHTDTGRTYKLYTESNPGGGDGINHSTPLW